MMFAAGDSHWWEISNTYKFKILTIHVSRTTGDSYNINKMIYDGGDIDLYCGGGELSYRIGDQKGTLNGKNNPSINL